MKTLALLLCLGSGVSAQSLHFGVRAGVPLTDVIDVADSRSFADTKRWTVGPAAEVGLPFGLAIGAEALYRRFESGSTSSVGSAQFSSQSDGSWWDFPVMVRFRPGVGPVRPMVGAGYVYNYIRTKNESSCTGDISLCGAGAAVRNVTSSFSRNGFTAGVGVELRVGVRIVPEIRYTRYQTENIYGRNQATFLVGLIF